MTTIRDADSVGEPLAGRVGRTSGVVYIGQVRMNERGQRHEEIEGGVGGSRRHR